MTEPVSKDALQVLNMELPSYVPVSTFTAARIKEIQTMRKAIKETTGVKMAFQKLPQHMRRRAMAHDVKRLPRRLREIHSNQMKKSGLPPKSKRPSRKYRRRPYNLLSDYARRRMRVKWLNTHIWHAKRFKMIEKWGYKLPYRPCDKAFRACYRATKQHCLLQDISYNRVVEINGKYEYLSEKLTKLNDTTMGLSFRAKCFSEGKKYGTVLVFQPENDKETYRKPVGQIQFLWRSFCDNNSSCLWIFIHPAFYSELLNILISLFELKLTNMDIDSQLNNIPLYEGPENVTLKELEFELSKIRLTGPLSTAVLKKTLKTVSFDELTDKPIWFKDSNIESLKEQNKLFENLSNINVLPPNLVFSTIVHDPRFNFPKKRTKAELEYSQMGDIEPYQKNISLSPLWNQEVRALLKENKTSNAKINEIRSELLVPGSDLPSKGEMVPVILLWRHGTRSGRQSGWDIILPSCWAQIFFIGFNMWGGRAGGLRETESIAFEESQVDILPPDSLAGQLEEALQEEECKDTYFRLPPNKRTSYARFSIVSPFKCQWSLLVKDWSNKDDFFVLRDRILLKNIKEYFINKSKRLSRPIVPENCLVPVEILPVKKGKCKDFAVICLPKSEDYKVDPVEPKCKDPNLKKRNLMRKTHKLMLKRMIKRRKRARKAGKPIIKTDTALLETYKSEMRKLWLPEAQSVKNSCSRNILGFVKKGGYCYSSGQSKGLGYVIGAALNTLGRRIFRNKVLVRNNNSRQYRLAVLNVIVE
ncbi:ribonucleases P/MRP protein subunit POP1 [Sitophilus oryzae]|uniref:Ribonucleases P/MRP protein subunit POP1 n=1 Tax=Sitophilus oryzae TaxID=7048 RepID=A0A6J2X4C8_SITOR|nr:ribonucleases P/MRP protein subunit POP1 [Sitophilus oryzae]